MFDISNSILSYKTELKNKDKIIREKEKKIKSLSKKLSEQQGINWILGQIIKCSGNLDSFRSLMDNVTDMLMGVMGLNACTVWIKNRDSFTTYSRSISNGNKFELVDSESLPSYIMKLKDCGVFYIKDKLYDFLKGKKAESFLIVPLNDYKRSKRIGIIVAEHSSKSYFTKARIDFFNILAIQISIAAENSKLFEKVSELSNKDILTNCYNRKYLKKLMLNINQNNKHYSLAVFDLDNFKEVNDNYGHEKGDQLLVEISKLALKYVSQYNGEVIRYGGDEFIIILFVGLNELKAMVEKFRKNVPKLEVIQEMDIDVTVTIGISSYPETVSKINNIFNVADNALLQAKKEGKNKVKVGYEKESLE